MCSDFGKASMLIRVELPVVVKPQILSKKALVNEGIESLIIYGKVPKSDNIIHVIVTVIYTSLLVIFKLWIFLFLPNKRNRSPDNRVINAEIKILFATSSRYAKPAKPAKSMKNDSIIKTRLIPPSTKR